MARFTSELRARVARRVQIESDLSVALRDPASQLFVHYQPQVDLASGRMVGVEALVRWRHPLEGLVSPVEMIPVAEASGLIGAVGHHVLRSACGQVAAWRAARPGQALSLTVNVSPRELGDPDYVPALQALLAETRLSPAALCLELTESALMKRQDELVAVLQRIRALGVYVAIDDFGTEHSSLARLRGLPVEVLKIDRSFIDGLSTEPEDTAVVSSILSLAFAMGKHVIAEGVERPEQAAALRSMGCGVAQGFLFSRPVAPDRIEAMLDGPLWSPKAVRTVSSAVIGDAGQARRGHRSFIDEFLEHIGAPMGAKPLAGPR